MNQSIFAYARQQRDLGFSTFYIEDTPAPSVFPPMTGLQPGSYAALEAIRAQYAACAACGLAQTRGSLVFGQGDPNARLMFVGEAPGADEDRQGAPFVGEAGKLLTKMIEDGMHLKRSAVYIANILKCRPPNNRDPLPEEIRQCVAILREQMKIIEPEFVCCLGRIAGRTILGLDEKATLVSMRGRVHAAGPFKVVVTYHPSALLRHAEWKHEAWNDLKMLMREMGLPLTRTVT